MKKLLLMLLPFIGFAQDMYLDHSFTNATPILVGDTLSIKFNTIDNNQTTFNFLQFDYQYNNKLLQKIDHTFNTNAQASLNHWDGYKFNPDPDKSTSDLTAQFNWWAGGAGQTGTSSYSGSSDWSVERITLQGSAAIPHADTFLTIRFLVKDKANTNYTDYTNVSNLSWARSNDNSTSTSNSIQAMTHTINLNDIKGGGAGDVVLKLQTQAEAKSDYMYSIQQDTIYITSGSFDINGEAVITELQNDEEYQVYAYVDDQNTDWLGDVVSITDAYMLFLEAINNGDYPTASNSNQVDDIKKVLFDVTGNGVIDFDDSYALLMHVVGEPLDNTYITTDSLAYNISTTDVPFKPTETNKSFNIYHYLAGDTDFSHSYYEEQVAAATFSLAKQEIVNHDLDLTTELIDGKIEFTVNLDRSDLSALEFIVNYDDTKLEFDKIIFNTGDNITNYSTKKEKAVYFGSIDPSAQLQVKTGQSYKIVFNPKVQVTNAAGLIYFKRQEAVTTEGQKINLNLK